MNWKDCDETSETHEDEREYYFHEGENSFWRKIHPGYWFSGFSSRPEKPFIIIGAGLIVLIVVFIALIVKKPVKDPDPFESYEARLKLLEEKIVQLEKVADQVRPLAERVQSNEQMIHKMNRSVAAVSSRVNAFSGELEKIDGKISTASLVKPASQKSVTTAETKSRPRYHKVRTGDTLYAISRRYGIHLNTLKRLNELNAGTVIHPGQKLIVGYSK